jgi:hypothetical protein
MDGNRLMVYLYGTLSLSSLAAGFLLAVPVIRAQTTGSLFNAPVFWFLVVLCISLIAIIGALMVLGNQGPGTKRFLMPFALVLPTVVVGAYGWQFLGTPGLLLAPLTIGVLYWGFGKIWQSQIVVTYATLLIIRHHDSTKLFVGPARVMQPLPGFEFIFARIPLYTMKSVFTVDSIDTREAFNVNIRLHIRYKLRNPNEWNKVMGMPNRPGIFAKLRGEFPKGMTDLLFWEHIFDVLVQEEVDIVLRRWMYRVHNIPELLDSAAPEQLQVGQGQSNQLAPQPAQRQPGQTSRRNTAYAPIIQRRQNLAEELKDEIAAVLDRWALEVETLEFLNIQHDREFEEDLRFVHHAELKRKQHELEANGVLTRLDAQATAQAMAIRNAITAVGEGVEELKKKGITPTDEAIRQMTHAAMEEMTLIFRLGSDVQARLDPSEDARSSYENAS